MSSQPIKIWNPFPEVERPGEQGVMKPVHDFLKMMLHFLMLMVFGNARELTHKQTRREMFGCNIESPQDQKQVPKAFEIAFPGVAVHAGASV